MGFPGMPNPGGMMGPMGMMPPLMDMGPSLIDMGGPMMDAGGMLGAQEMNYANRYKTSLQTKLAKIAA
jgi:hypothetical protein